VCPRLQFVYPFVQSGGKVFQLNTTDVIVRQQIVTASGQRCYPPNHNDSITIGASGNGVRVTLNGEVAQFELGQIGSIVVNTGAGAIPSTSSRPWPAFQ
jgi:hypothetical protein